MGFVYIFELSGTHVEYTHKSITSSPINFWLHEKNAAFMGLGNFLSRETNIILNILLGVDTLTGVGLNYILPWTTTADFIYSKNYIYNMKMILSTIIGNKEWNKQESYSVL